MEANVGESDKTSEVSLACFRSRPRRRVTTIRKAWMQTRVCTYGTVLQNRERTKLSVVVGTFSQAIAGAAQIEELTKHVIDIVVEILAEA